VDEKNKNAQDFNLTTPNIRVPNNPNRPAAPASEHDRTMPNAPSYPKDYGSSPQSSPRNAFDLTAVNFEAPGVEDDDEAVPPPRPSPPPQFQPQQQFQPPPQQAPFRQPSPAMTAPAPKRRIPLWAWLVSGGALMLLLLAVGGGALWLGWDIIFGSPSFTLKVLKAPAGSKVFVDDVDRSGVPQADGTIIIQGLKAGEPRDVRVAHEGYQDFNTTVTGEGRETLEVIFKSPTNKVDDPLLSEIDYNGKMMLVPAGPFTMGDDKHLPDEQPAHPVEVPAFYIDKYEVTNELYKKFCDATRRAYPPSPWWDQQYFNSKPQAPVVGISWDDAAKYAEWAGKRLPKEEEWEKAASWDPKAKAKRQWPWGDTPEQGRANVGQKIENLKLLTVGQNPGGASAYGVHDMIGNAGEWVDAYYQPYEDNKMSNPDFGTKNRVVRGGTCYSSLDDARTTRRFPRPPDYTAQEKAKGTLLVGFRCAVSADNTKLREHLSKAGGK